MKKYTKFVLLTLGLAGFLASCQCKTCSKAGEPTYTFCKDEGTEEEYNDLVDAWVAGGYECK